MALPVLVLVGLVAMLGHLILSSSSVQTVSLTAPNAGPSTAPADGYLTNLPAPSPTTWSPTTGPPAAKHSKPSSTASSGSSVTPTHKKHKPKPTSTATPSTVSPNGSFAEQVFELTNNERIKAGCKPLTVDSKLTSAAQAHSTDMAENNYFSHDSQDGKSPFDRMKAAGYNFRAAGENIAAGQQTPTDVMDSWMNSPGHRANILNCTYTNIGVGVAKGGSFGIYWTQDFGTPL